MLELLKCTPEHFSRCCVRASLVLLLLTMGARSVRAQGWSWSFGKVDSGAKFTSLAVDSGGDRLGGAPHNSPHGAMSAYCLYERVRWRTMCIEKERLIYAALLYLS